MATKKVKISEKEATFVNLILNGAELLDAYREVWHNGYSDSKARHTANEVMKRPHVAEYMQNQILERNDSMMLDEAYVIDGLKQVVRERPGTTQAVAALKLLGQYLAMFVDRQVVETTGSQGDLAQEMFERRQAIERGEEVAPLSDDTESKEAELIEFELYNGTDG